jgi:predicted MFS family arabinose efflux permease
MLSERIGFSNVFFVAFSLVVIGGLFALKGMANSTVSKGASANAGDTANFGLLRFFRDPQIVMFFMLVLIPMAIAGMFLNYFFPLYAENSGVSPANIGRAYLLNGLCIVYLGPVISTFAEKHLGAKRALVGSGLIVMLAMIIFAWTGSFGAALVSVALLGVAEGFGITAQINYYITRQASVSLGEGKAMGYYGLVENFGQMLGPVMIGTAVAQMGMANGIGLISVLLAGCMALFLVASRQRRQTAVHTDRGIGGDM